LFRFDARELHQPGPFLDFVGDEFAEFGEYALQAL
jgi:hypothetical protein